MYHLATILQKIGKSRKYAVTKSNLNMIIKRKEQVFDVKVMREKVMFKRKNLEKNGRRKLVMVRDGMGVKLYWSFKNLDESFLAGQGGK